MTEMVFGTVPARAADPVLPRWWRTIDRWALASVLALFGVGMLLGLAASVPLAEKNGFEPFYYVKRQAAFGGLALVVMFALSLMSPVQLRRLGVLGFAGALLALCALPLFGTDFGKGAVRWFSLGFASLQPSEFLKPGYAIMVGWMMAAAHEVAGPPGRFYSFVLTAFIVVMLALQPDYGQASLVLMGWGAMYFVSGGRILPLAAVAGLAAGGMAFAYRLSPHVAGRINGFLSPDIDPRTQIGYATNAIQEGGFFGVGVGEGAVKWQLPDAHTDFIIAVAAEEYGLVLVLVILALYATVVLRSLTRLMRERDPFARIAGTGLAFSFGVQALINMGVAVRLLPAKGMTLPFVSYGGSSVIASGIALGLLLALTRTRPQNDMSELLSRRPHR